MKTEAEQRAGRAYYERNKDLVKAKAAAQYAANRADPAYPWREKQLWYKHKLTPAGFTLLWQAQNGCCFLCEKPLDLQTCVIDHNHDCCPKTRSCERCRRGLAHRRCNALVGLADDDVLLLERITGNFAAAVALQEEGSSHPCE